VSLDDSEKGNFSRLMVRNGFAVAYRRYRSMDRETLIGLDEASARENKRGMWAACPMDLSKVPKNLGSEMPIPPARS
jgi:endonuclease YncB( thermonuclease family)